MYARWCPIWVLCLIPLLFCGSVDAADKEGPEVAVMRPVVGEVTDHEDFTGRTEAAARVELRARVTGYLTAVRFKDGDTVKQGDVLFEIDPRPYQAQLNQTLAQIELHKAMLQAAQAALARGQALARAGQGNISKQQLEQDQAAVAEAAAKVKVAEASAELGKLNLSFCKVAAPISGPIGQRQVVPGDLVQQDQTLLAVLVSEEPLHVHFQSDERTLLRLRRALLADKVQQGKLPVSVGLADEEGFPHPGQLDFTDNRVDPDTGSISLRATLTKKDRLLVPGLFVRVRLALGAPHKALLIDDRAIASDEGRKYVYVLDPNNKVEQRPVKTGALHDGLRVVAEGLKSEDRVLVGRRTGIRPGMTVQPKEVAAPAPKAPAPSEEGAAPARGQVGLGVVVEATYAGADAQVVSDTVRAPIEQQVRGIENIRYLRSRCTSDGKYALHLAFAPRVDLGIRLVLVQNRVALALPQLPKEVQEAGLDVRRGTGGLLAIASLSSPEGKYDRVELSNFATFQIKDELSCLPGVGEVALFGARDYGMQIWLDPDRLAAHNVNAGDVTSVLRKEKLEGALDPDALASLIVRTDREGRPVRLRDIGRAELGARGPRSEAFQDGRPVVALAIHLTGDAAPAKVRTALETRLAEIRDRLPEGLALDVSVDFTANLEARPRAPGAEYVLLDLDFSAASADEMAEILKQSDSLLRRLPGVQRVLALSENPFDLFGGRPCLLIQLTPPEQRNSDREEIMRAIRTRHDELKDVTVRLRDFSVPGCFPRCGYPIDLALSGPDAAEVREWATKLADRLRRRDKWTDVWTNTEAVPRTRRLVDIDRARATALGVAVADVFSAIEVFTGAVPVNQFSRFGRTWRVEVQSGARSDDWARDLGKLKVRNARGQMVALGNIATVREVEAPRALDFLDLRPMVELTANAGAGASIAAGRELCTKLAEEVHKEMGLTPEYRLTWLTVPVGGK